jgi:hypothetical protein
MRFLTLRSTARQANAESRSDPGRHQYPPAAHDFGVEVVQFANTSSATARALDAQNAKPVTPWFRTPPLPLFTASVEVGAGTRLNVLRRYLRHVAHIFGFGRGDVFRRIYPNSDADQTLRL